MWETAERRPAEARIELPSEAAARFRELGDSITHRTTIVWGEHCTECAFPSCYSSCTFYTPREDFHCRRFEKGVELVKGAGDLPPNLVRISFRRWAKLEGRSPLGMKSIRAARRLEKLDAAVGLPLRTLPLDIAGKVSWRLNSLKRHQAELGDPVDATDQFVVEAWHDGLKPAPFTITLLPSGMEADRLFQTGIALDPGYNRICVAAREIAQHIDLRQPCLIQLEPTVEHTPPIVFGVLDFVRTGEPIRTFPSPTASVAGGERPKVKCVVWDLDNTVWDGVLVEDGIDGVVPFPNVIEVIKALDARGILNSIASKNDPDLAVMALKQFGLLDYFVFPQISWNPKSDGIRQIAASLDIGSDTFVFIDDQPFERGEIAAFLPEVDVLPETAVDELLAMPRFDVPVTAESATRRLMYKTEEQRAQALTTAGYTDYNQFLRECGIRLKVAPLSTGSLIRVFELSQRTNQLNVSGQRYSREALESMLEEGAADSTYVLSCEDRFGEYGIIGFCVLDRSRRRIESFFMSCRVQRKRVENAFFGLLSEELAREGVDRLSVKYQKTAKNGAVFKMLSELGFDYEAQDEERGEFVRRTSAPVVDREVVSVERLHTVEALTA